MKKICSIIIIVLYLVTIKFSVNAHSQNLMVEYDECNPSSFVDDSNIGDGYDEKWYELSRNNRMQHISNNGTITTIKYYFSNNSIDENISWTTDLTNEQIREFQQGLIYSMKKWNNIYFYIDNENYYEKRRLVNIVEGTETDNNLVIYPTIDKDIAGTSQHPFYIHLNEEVENENIKHIHTSKWMMEISIDVIKKYFKDEKLKNKVLERLGAHELGHILGLYDIDIVENNANTEKYHHEENLMGYSHFEKLEQASVSFVNRQSEITYRDIAGVAITRGYHNDYNHKWLCDEILKDGKYKLICSICNGIKYVESLSDYEYNLYKKCNMRHNLIDGNMMPVASYGTKDYYKCKYCRYVAPVIDRIEQNYVTDCSYNSTYHYNVNDVFGFEYRTIAKHDYEYNVDTAHCKYCDYYVLMNEIVVTDPDSATNCGSQINIYEQDKLTYEKSYRGNTIVEGYTRLLYFSSQIAPSLSRLDYEWESSNPNIAIVSSYGTVTACNVDEPKMIVISAKHKTSNVTLYKKLLIIPDTSNKLLEVNYELTIQNGQTHNLELDNNAPSTYIQNYIWTIINENGESNIITIDKWGKIATLSKGVVYVRGQYKFNSNITILIKIRVN